MPNYPHCYICGDSNRIGFQQKFFYDDATDSIFTDFTPSSEYAGYKDIVHGGVFLAMLDEVMAWACIKSSGRPCLTLRMESRFIRKALCNVPYRISGKVDRARGKMLFASSRVTGSSGELFYESTAVYMADQDDTEFNESLHNPDIPL